MCKAKRNDRRRRAVLQNAIGMKVALSRLRSTEHIQRIFEARLTKRPWKKSVEKRKKRARLTSG